MASLGIARPGLPIIVPVTEFRDIIGIALTNMINGADAATELKKAGAEFLPVLEKERARLTWTQSWGREGIARAAAALLLHVG